MLNTNVPSKRIALDKALRKIPWPHICREKIVLSGSWDTHIINLFSQPELRTERAGSLQMWCRWVREIWRCVSSACSFDSAPGKAGLLVVDRAARVTCSGGVWGTTKLCEVL